MIAATKLDSGSFRSRAELSTTLPAAWYFDPEIYRLEHERIFYRSWWYQCHQASLAKPGDRYCSGIADRPVRLANRDGRIDAWSGSDPARVENYAGFLFVNLDRDAVPLIDQAPVFMQDMRACCPELEHLLPVRRFEREIGANWKTLIDNNHECYHCNANHPSLMELVDYDNKAVWSDDSISFSHRVERKTAQNSAYTLDEATLTQDSLFGYIWPNLIPLFFPGSPSLIMLQVLPLAPEKSLIRHDFFLLDGEPSAQELRFMDWFSQVLNREDVSLCESVQRGLHSQGYRHGRFIVDRAHVEYSEHHVHLFQAMVERALLG